MSRSTWITTFVVLAAIAIAFILEATKAEPAPIQNTTAVIVRVRDAKPEALPGAVSAGGFLRAHADVTISAERAGRLVALPVAAGETAARGRVIAEIDADAAEANLVRARVVLQELQVVAATPVVDLARAREALAVAENEWSARHPRAPIRGVVDLRHVDVGEYVRPGTPLLDIVDLSVLILDVDLDAEAVIFVKEGDEVDVEVSALVGAHFVGIVTRVARRAAASTRRFRVEVSIRTETAAAKRVRPGMYGQARFRLPAAAPALYLPKESVRTIRAQRGVFVVQGSPATVAWQPVVTHGVHHRPDLWRVENVPVGAVVVIEGFAGLREGLAVEAVR